MTQSGAGQLPNNPELRAAVEGFVRNSGDSATQEAVFRALLRASLIFPSAGSTPGKISLAFIKDPSGNLITPAFTDSEALFKWAPSGQSVSTAEAPGFVPAVLAGPSSGLVLNPGSKASVVFDRKMLESLAGRLRPPQ